MVVFLEGSSISTKELYSSVRVTIGFLVTSLTKALLPRLLSFPRAGRPARVLEVPNFFHLRMMEATVFLGTINDAETFSFRIAKGLNTYLNTLFFFLFNTKH